MDHDCRLWPQSVESRVMDAFPARDYSSHHLVSSWRAGKEERGGDSTNQGGGGVLTEGLCPHILRIRGIHVLQSMGYKHAIFSVYQLHCSFLSCNTAHTTWPGHIAHCIIQSHSTHCIVHNLHISNPEVKLLLKAECFELHHDLPMLWRRRKSRCVEILGRYHFNGDKRAGMPPSCTVLCPPLFG